jgi:hypothetical protein
MVGLLVLVKMVVVPVKMAAFPVPVKMTALPIPV